jgi:hypothetical protein
LVFRRAQRRGNGRSTEDLCPECHARLEDGQAWLLAELRMERASTGKWDEQLLRGGSERLVPMKKPVQQLIAEVSRRQPRVEMTMEIELGDVWSHSAHSTNKERSLVASGAHRRPLRSGSPICLQHASPWRRERIRSRSTSSCRSWV